MTYREAYMKEIGSPELAAKVHARLCPMALQDLGYRIIENTCGDKRATGGKTCKGCWDSQMLPEEGTPSMRAAMWAEKFQQEFSGISYQEWFRLREGVEEMFKYKKREAEKSLCLCPDDDVGKIIRSRFG